MDDLGEWNLAMHRLVLDSAGAKKKIWHALATGALKELGCTLVV